MLGGWAVGEEDSDPGGGETRWLQEWSRPVSGVQGGERAVLEMKSGSARAFFGGHMKGFCVW